MISALELTGYYRFDHVTDSADEAERLIQAGRRRLRGHDPLGLRRPGGARRPSAILVEADATDPASASGAIATLGTVAAQALLRATGREAEAAEAAAGSSRSWCTAATTPRASRSTTSSPGLLGVILQMTMVMMTSIALTRETERGTMETLLAMPSTPAEIMLSKILPYFAVGAVQVAVVLLAARGLFARPLRRRPRHAPPRRLRLRAGAGAARLRHLDLSPAPRCRRCSSPSSSSCRRSCSRASCSRSAACPTGRRCSAQFFPLTHFIRAIRAVMLKGADIGDDLAASWLLLGLFVAAYAAVALVRFRRTLD